MKLYLVLLYAFEPGAEDKPEDDERFLVSVPAVDAEAVEAPLRELVASIGLSGVTVCVHSVIEARQEVVARVYSQRGQDYELPVSAEPKWLQGLRRYFPGRRLYLDKPFMQL